MNIRYQSGFGTTFSTEAERGALPIGQNSPQKTPKGLIAEVLSGSAFTAPRAENLSSWLYRIRPTAMHGPFKRWDDGLLRSGLERVGMSEVTTYATELESLQALVAQARPGDVIGLMCHAERQECYDWIAAQGGSADSPETLSAKVRAAGS